MYIFALSKKENMQDTKVLNYIKDVLQNIPSDWLHLTTHRLDIYNEEEAKTQFLEQFEALFKSNTSDAQNTKEQKSKKRATIRVRVYPFSGQSNFAHHAPVLTQSPATCKQT